MSAIASAGILSLGFVLCAAGCGDDRQATADDVVYLFRSAKVGAKTWRLPEPAQGYVDTILKSYAEWHKAYAPMEEMNAAGALWSIDSAKWQSSKEINDALLKYTKFREAGASDKRYQLVSDLQKAIRETPEIPDRQGLADRIVQVIWDGETEIPQPNQVEDYPVAKSIEVLLNDVQKHMDKLDASTTGLRFTDAELQVRIHEQHGAIKAQIAEMQTAELAQWEVFLAEQSDQAKELSPKVREMGATMSDRADLEYRRQKLQLEYHEEAAKFAEKKIKALKKALKQDEAAPTEDSPNGAGQTD